MKMCCTLCFTLKFHKVIDRKLQNVKDMCFLDLLEYHVVRDKVIL